MFKDYATPRFGNIDGLKHVNNTVVADWFEMGRNGIFRYFTPDLGRQLRRW